MGNTSFAGLGGGAVAGAAVAVAVAIAGYIIYDRATHNPPKDQAVEAVLQPKPAPVSQPGTPAQPDRPVESASAPAATEAPAQQETPTEATAAEETADTSTTEATARPPKQDAADNAVTETVSDTPVAEAQDPAVTAGDEGATDPKPQTVETASTAPSDDGASPQSAEVAPETPAPQDTVAPAAAPLDPPRFDVVRVDAEGNALVAGNAAPESAITVLLDRAEIASTAADRAGKFVALFDIAPSNQPRSITLLMTAGDMQLASVETVVIEPVRAPAPVAIAEQTPSEPVAVASADTTEGTDALNEQPASASLDVAATPDVSQAEPAARPLAEVKPDQTVPAQTETAQAETAETEFPAVSPEAVVPSEITTAPAETSAPVAATPAAPRVLIADADGVRVLSDPAKQEGISIDTISYTVSGNAVVAGRGQVGSVVRIYLNGALTAETAVDDAGVWTVELQDVTPGVYRLRADQLDAQGKVSFRVETPFKRESQEVLAAVQAPVAQPENPATEAKPAPQEGQGTEPTEAGSIEDVAQVSVVTVQPGFTLWGIAAERYGDGFLYVKVFDANADQIRNPDLIYPGQVFTVPE